MLMLAGTEATNPCANGSKSGFKILALSFVPTFHITFNFVPLAWFFLSFSYEIKGLTVTQ